MYLPYFIAKRLFTIKSKTFSGFISRLSIISTAISIAVMILSTALFDGFNSAITNKFYDQWGHMMITGYQDDGLDDTLSNDPILCSNLARNKEIRNIIPYYTKNAVIKSKSGIQGIVLKGIQNSEHLKSFSPYLEKGSIPLNFSDTGYSKDIYISKYLAERLDLKQGSSVIAYFMDANQEQPKARKLQIKGIYNTGLHENDKVIIPCDMRLLHKIDNDSLQQITGYQIHTIPNADIATLKTSISALLPSNMNVMTLQEKYEKVFQWLDLVKDNVKIIYLIMICVAFINMITTILIYIMDRTQMIGILKGLGSKQRSIGQIFFWQSMITNLLGIGAGIILACILAVLHNQFPLFRLDPNIYYLETIKLEIHPLKVIYIGLATLGIGLLFLAIPWILIRRVNIIKALKFD